MTQATQPPTDASLRAVVIDVSVVAKWFLVDEANAAHAQRIRDAWERGELQAAAPGHIRVEVPRALQLAMRDGRLEAQVAVDLLDEFLDIELPTVPTDDLVRDAFGLCSQYGLAMYDSLYCALAERLEWPLLLADERLYNRLRGQLTYLVPVWEWHAIGT